jgi:sec-independent protein translocase protein TatA
MNVILAFGFSPGPLEIFIIAVIILLLFGNRLPSVMRSLGKGIVEFKKGVKGIEDDVEGAADAKENEKQPANK